MDAADRAQADAEWQEHVRRVAAEMRQNKRSKTHCVECGEPIEQARRKALSGVTLCIDCAELQERRPRAWMRGQY